MIAGNATTLSYLYSNFFFLMKNERKDGKKSGLFTLFLPNGGPILVQIFICIQILSIYYNMSNVNNKAMIIILVFFLLSSYYLLVFFHFSGLRPANWISRIIAPFSVIILVACGSAIWMSCETLIFIGSIFFSEARNGSNLHLFCKKAIVNRKR